MSLKGRWKDGLPSSESIKSHTKQLWMIVDEAWYVHPVILRITESSLKYISLDHMRNPKHWPVDENGDRIEYDA